VFLYRLVRVLGTTWKISAFPSQHRGEETSIQGDQLQQPPAGLVGAELAARHLSSSTSTADATQVFSSSKGTLTTAGVATSTYARPFLMGACATASRIRRLARLRSTAPPTFLPAVTATRGLPGSPGASKRTMPPTRRLDPVRRTFRISRLRSEANGRPLRGEPVTALAAPSLENGAPRAGAHAGTKSVLALAASNIRLIRALHKRSQERGRYAAAARLRTVWLLVKG
jgi:hypothetical protein